MSTNHSNNSGKVSVGTIGLVVIVIVVIVAVGSILMSAPKDNRSVNDSTLVLNKNNQVTNPATNTNQGEQEQPKEIPAEVKAFVGTIVSVNAESITVQAEEETNYLNQDTRLTAEFTSSTVFTKITSPRTVRADQDVASLMKREIITAKDLKVGDLVTVIATANAKGKTAFQAGQIEVRMVE